VNEALFGLPAKVQLSLPAVLLGSYLDGFERRWPEARWARAQLADPTLPEKDFNAAAGGLSAQLTDCRIWTYPEPDPELLARELAAWVRE
jgi:hypothetical protein